MKFLPEILPCISAAMRSCVSKHRCKRVVFKDGVLPAFFYDPNWDIECREGNAVLAMLLERRYGWNFRYYRHYFEEEEEG